jgi:glycosyltransferase involved in cell wall biosynthesis
VIILHVLEPFASGVAAAVSAIAGEMPDYSHIVIHGSRNNVESVEEVRKRFPPGVTFIEWENAGREISPVKDWKAFWELTAILKKYTPLKQKEIGPVVVHLHSSKAGFLGRLACRVLGIRAVIYTPHCGAFLRTDINFLKRTLYRFLEWLGGCLGGRVAGCGPSEGELYKKLGRNTTYVSNGVILKEKHKTQGSRNLVSFTGIASFQKDPALWSAVAASCANIAREEGYSFYWIGDGPLAEELDRNRVTFTGWKGAEEVEELLEKTAVYFSASAWEGLPYGVLEAMNASCALLLRNVPGNRELVISGENGWLFDTQEEAVNHLTSMLKDKPFLFTMGMRSREILEQGYTLKQMGEGYRSLYVKAAEESGGGR